MQTVSGKAVSIARNEAGIGYGRTKITRRALRCNLALATAIVLVTAAVRPISAQPGGQVNGSVFAEARSKRLPLSGIRVYVQDVVSATLSQKVKTDSNGRFVVPEQPPGTYRLCWKASGFAAGCKSEPFIIDNGAAVLSPVQITPKGGVVSGHVTLADGNPCHYVDPFFRVDVSTSVALVDSKGAKVAGPVPATASGDYLLTKVPAGTFRLLATCEDSRAETKLTTRAAGDAVMDLPFDNHPPIVSAVVAALRGQAVQGVPPGTTVEVTANATDIDGDALHYKWVTQGPGLTSEDASTIQWTLPKSGGLHTLYVLVADGNGGYRMGRVEISTDENLVFSPTIQARSASLTASLTDFAAAAEQRGTEQMGTVFLTFKGEDTAESACQYYRAIGALDNSRSKDCASDPELHPGDGITFDQWKLKNRLYVNPDANLNGNQFDDDGTTGEASALYLNFVDLDLARAMHGKASFGRFPSFTVAYYVCNYQTLKDARRNRNLVACVAFDYTSSSPFTKFYVFGPGGDLLSTADLDKQGPKYVPGLCVACHGGDAYSMKFSPKNAAAFGNIGAHFLPFDLDNFKYLDNSLLFDRLTQESKGKFRRLNQMILDTEPTAAVEELITKIWYPPDRPEDEKYFQVSDGVPAGWTGREPLYNDVVKQSCRSCHVALLEQFFFNTFEGFKKKASPQIASRVCNTDGTRKTATYQMPHARQTFNLFWNKVSPPAAPHYPKPHEPNPETLQEFLNTEGGLEKATCTAPLPLPPPPVP